MIASTDEVFCVIGLEERIAVDAARKVEDIIEQGGVEAGDDDEFLFTLLTICTVDALSPGASGPCGFCDIRRKPRGLCFLPISADQLVEYHT